MVGGPTGLSRDDMVGGPTGLSRDDIVGGPTGLGRDDMVRTSSRPSQVPQMVIPCEQSEPRDLWRCLISADTHQ